MNCLVVKQRHPHFHQSVQSTENARKWLEMIQEYVRIDELTPEILHRLIKEIVVHEAIDRI